MTRPSVGKLTNFLLILSLLFCISCSKEKETLSARVYHSSLSYFNGYYNANYLYEETLKKLESQYSYPEQGFIEVVYYGSKDEVKSFENDFEEIAKKNDRVIFKHPNGNYIDECRLLNGKSWFYRQDYYKALQNFDFVLDSFPDSKLAPEAWFWIAQTQYQMENPEVASEIVDERLLYADSVILEDKMLDELGLFRTKLAIDKEDYPAALKILTEHIEYINGRMRKARAHFLLGQLYDATENFPKALEQFEMVGKYSETYYLTFISKMKIARLYVDFQEGKDDDQIVQDYLTKLLKDEKNEEYQDRIYFEFAMLELKKGNRDEAIAYLRESIRSNMNNQRQKALSYYKIGQIHFYDLQDYNTAQAYYDSAATSINQDAPEYQEITTLAKTLKNYITQINTIHYQDSMLYLASLPKEEVDKIVDVLVKEEEERKKEELARQLEEQESLKNNDPFFNPLLQNQNRQRNRNNQSGGAGNWYFDNPGSVSNGRIQFQQLWGNRQNADHWRRSNKTSVAVGGIGGAGEESGPGGSSTIAVDSAMLEKYGDNYKYYVDIPDTEERKEESLAMIEEALYKLGQIYSQRLDEPDSAIKTFNTLLDRFEDSEFALRTRYALFKLYSEKRDKLARVHRSIIINEYPKTIYAYLILGKDPNELKKDEEDFIYAYEGLFNAYADKQYETSLGFSEYLLAQSQFNDNPAIDLAKLHYIRGMSYGFTGDQDSLRNILTRVVNTYPEHEVTPIAQKTLNYLQNGIPEDKKPISEATGESEAVDLDPKRDPNNPAYRGFTTEVKPTDKIFVLMYVRKEKISKADATKLINEFNKKAYAQSRFKVFAFLYKQTHLLPYISTFKSVEDASGYVDAFKADPSSGAIISSSDEKVFYISHSNFKVAYGQKRMADYINYYEYIINGK